MHELLTASNLSLIRLLSQLLKCYIDIPAVVRPLIAPMVLSAQRHCEMILVCPLAILIEVYMMLFRIWCTAYKAVLRVMYYYASDHAALILSSSSGVRVSIPRSFASETMPSTNVAISDVSYSLEPLITT